MDRSASIDIYRLQAACSDGGIDGKIGVPRDEFVFLQMLMDATVFGCARAVSEIAEQMARAS